MYRLIIIILIITKGKHEQTNQPKRLRIQETPNVARRSDNFMIILSVNPIRKHENVNKKLAVKFVFSMRYVRLYMK